MDKIYIAFEKLAGFNKSKTVQIAFDGTEQEAQEHLKSEEFEHLLTASNGFDPKIIIKKLAC